MLAGTRFALAFIVMTHHLGGYADPNDLVHQIGRLGALASIVGFFIISGYSMANSLHRDPDTWRFFKRRFWRIYPVYVWAIVLSTLPSLLFFTVWSDVRPGFLGGAKLPDMLNALVFLQGFTTRELPGNGVVWTLAIEWWLYMLSPIFNRLSLTWLKILIGLSIALYLVHDYFGVEYYHEIYGMAFLCYAWAFIGGFAFYRFREKLGSLIALLGISAYLVCYRLSGSFEQFAPLTVAATVYIVWISDQINLTDRWRKILNWLGGVSYPLYLVHVPVMCTLYGFNYHNGLGIALACLAFAILTYHIIDLPIQWLVKRARKSRPKPIVAAP